MKSKDNFKEEIIKRLDTVIKLLTLSSMKEETQIQKISLLSNAGFAPKEIADIIGTTPNTVRVALSKSKKKSSKEVTNDKQRSDEGLDRKEKDFEAESLSNNEEEEKTIW